MFKKVIVRRGILLLCYLLLTGASVLAQYSSVDTLKGFLCYKFGDTTIMRNAEVRRTQTNGKFIIYHKDTSNYCGMAIDGLTLSYYEGKLYQIFIDLAGEKESMSLLNIFTKAFGPYKQTEIVSKEYEIRTYVWAGDKVGIDYTTDATYTGAKILIYDRIVQNKMYNLHHKDDLNNDEKKLLGRIIGRN